MYGYQSVLRTNASSSCSIDGENENNDITEKEKQAVPSSPTRYCTARAQAFWDSITPLCSKLAQHQGRRGVTHACVLSLRTAKMQQRHGRCLGQSCAACARLSLTKTWPAAANQRRRVLMSKPLTLPRCCGGGSCGRVVVHPLKTARHLASGSEVVANVEGVKPPT
jgi:hypothetical protein